MYTGVQGPVNWCKWCTPCSGCNWYTWCNSVTGVPCWCLLAVIEACTNMYSVGTSQIKNEKEYYNKNKEKGTLSSILGLKDFHLLAWCTSALY